MKLGSEHVQRCFALSYISLDSRQSRLHLGWRSKWCFVHNFLPELFFDVFGSHFSFATSTWQPLTFSQYWHSVSWTLTWKRAMPPFQFPLEWLCIDFGTTVNCANKRMCIWLDHNWSSSFFPNSCFQRCHRYSVEESEGRNDLAVDIYNDENDVDVNVFLKMA